MLILAVAQLIAANTAEPLWRNIQSGMSIEQVHALYPEEKGRVKWKSGYTEIRGALQIGKCTPKVIVYHGEGVVERVETGMVPVGLRDTCTPEAYEAMLSKYGRPTSEMETDKASPAGFKYKNVVSTWVRQGIAIVMERDTGYHDDKWWVTYKPLDSNSGL